MNDGVPQLKAFIIGPIGDRDALHGSEKRVLYEEAIQIFEEVIVPACNALDVFPLRADQITRSGEIPEQIFRHIRDSSVVIADLTGANPNVMYELGLRHTTGKLTIQLGERDRLLFDVAAIRTIMFKRTDGGLVDARRKLIAALANGLGSGGDPVTATRVWFEQESLSSFTSTDLIVHEGIEDLEEPGFLEILADTEDGLQTLSQAIVTSTAIVGEIGQIIIDHTAKVNALVSNQGYSSARLAIVNKMAVLLEDPAARFKISCSEYANSVERMEPGLIYMLTRLATEPDSLAEAPEFPSQMSYMIKAAVNSIENTMEFKITMDSMGGASRSLRKVGNKISTTLQLFIDSSQRVGSWHILIDAIPLTKAD